jgi:hypothetical protein
MYIGVSAELGLRGRSFQSPAQVARAIYRARGWWPELVTDYYGQLCVPYYIVGPEHARRIVWRGMARWRQAAWRGDWAIIASPRSE